MFRGMPEKLIFRKPASYGRIDAHIHFLCYHPSLCGAECFLCGPIMNWCVGIAGLIRGTPQALFMQYMMGSYNQLAVPVHYHGDDKPPMHFLCYHPRHCGMYCYFCYSPPFPALGWSMFLFSGLIRRHPPYIRCVNWSIPRHYYGIDDPPMHFRCYHPKHCGIYCFLCNGPAPVIFDFWFVIKVLEMCSGCFWVGAWQESVSEIWALFCVTFLSAILDKYGLVIGWYWSRAFFPRFWLATSHIGPLHYWRKVFCVID